MDQRHGQTAKETSIRKYFMKPPAKPSPGCAAIGFFILGAIFTLAALAALASQQKASASDSIGLILAPMVFIGIGAIIIYVKNSSYKDKIQEGEPKPSDGQVEQWLREGVGKITQRSAEALGLSSEESSVAEPLVITGPILWTTNGISNEDLAWKKGSDGAARFGVYRITIIRLTDRHLGSYACDYNFIRDVALNEKTDEYHYRDVVSVSTREQASSYTLPTGEKLTTAREFALSVASGESIRVTIDADQLRKITGVEKLPETGADKAVSIIRTMLRDKKA